MSFHYPTVNYQIPLHFRLKRGEPPLNCKSYKIRLGDYGNFKSVDKFMRIFQLEN